VRPDDIDAAALMAAGADRVPRAFAARATLGVSPASVGLAFADWWLHLAASPGKQLELARKAARKWVRYAHFLGELARGNAAAQCIEPLEQDSRFAAPDWRAWPYNALSQGFLLTQQWWHNATTGVRGVTRQHEALVNFTVRQMLDVWSPSNFTLTNPEVVRATLREAGANHVRGVTNFVQEWERAALGRAPAGAEAFLPGE
jgi:polyhydroxyalkanoate synthase